jgi:hypothetical protein
MNQVMGAKMWWRWLQHPNELWAQLWKQNYAPNVQHDQLIRLNEQKQGSNIWITAWNNRSLIQQHAFWEIKNGESARFWKDSWQQLPPLDEVENLQLLKPHLLQRGFDRVMDFWIPNQARTDWRQWKLNKTELQLSEDFDLIPWQECLSNRKIPFKDGADLIRWGHSTSGTFTVKEAYHLLLNLPI